MSDDDRTTPPPHPKRSGWQPPTVEELQALLPQYEITGILGRGGMGAVYRGRQLSLGRSVAIKILRAELDDSDIGFSERFKNEARAMAKLSHPGIVAVYSFGEAPGGLLYIVMEYVEGTDVSRMIAEQGRLPVEHAMAITAHVCDALAYAHSSGIIHRDIKPANIMVSYEGVVKVADFGLAKLGSADQSQGLTLSGMAMGTMHFMAPEAMEYGVTVDHRADLYAVGVMLYQMLTGKLPKGLFTMPSILVPGLDPRYDEIITRAMYEDREQRYQSAEELRADLDGLLSQPVVKVEENAKEAPAALPTQARPQRNGRREKPEVTRTQRSSFHLWGILLLLVGLVGWLVMKRDEKSYSVGIPTTSVSASNNDDSETSASLEDATRDKPFVNSLGMKFVPVPGTNVLFCIHETRYRDYASYAAEIPLTDNSWKEQAVLNNSISEKRDDHPVLSVTWNEATAFCTWLSNREGCTYRLPTDHEWSCAVGVGSDEVWNADTTPLTVKKDTKTFLWGLQWPPYSGAGNFSDESRHTQALTEGENFIAGYNDGYPTSAPVMTFPPNSLGIYDLGGNAIEWCDDWYDVNRSYRVLRGASYSSWWKGGHERESFLASNRVYFPSGSRRGSFGLRPVVEMTKAGVPSPAALDSTITPSTAPTPELGEPWVDGLAKWWGGAKDNESFVRDAGGTTKAINGGGPMNVFPKSSPPFRDQAVRVRALLDHDAVHVGVTVRMTIDESGVSTAYRATLSKQLREVRMFCHVSGVHRHLEDFALPTDFDFSIPHTLELRAVGDMIAVSLDQKLLGTHRDTGISSGHPSFATKGGAVIERFEYLILDPPDNITPKPPSTSAPAPPASSSSTSSPTPAVTQAPITPLPAAPVVKPTAPPNPELLALNRNYEAAIEKQVTPAVDAYARTLITGYTNALERAAKSPETEASEVTAILAEIGRVKVVGTIPDNDMPESTATIRELRSTYRNAVTAFRDKKLKTLETIYKQQVLKLERDAASSTAPR